MEDYTLLLVTAVLVLAVTGTIPLLKTITRVFVMIIGIVGLININMIPLDTNGKLAFLSSVDRYVSVIHFVNEKLNIHIPSIDISLAQKSQQGCKHVIAQISNQFGNKNKKRP